VQESFDNVWVTAAPPPPDTSAIELICTLVGDPVFAASDDSGFAIRRAEFAVPGERAPRAVKIKGSLAHATTGETLTCQGRWIEDARYGWQFAVETFSAEQPVTADGVATWLQTRIDGVGPVFAEAIVRHFTRDGNDPDVVFEILDADPTRLREVKTKAGRAISAKQVESAISQWADVRAIRAIEAFLFSHGITENLAARLNRRYGAGVIDILTNDPYRVTEMPRIGFRLADRIARDMGVELDDPARLQAGVIYTLSEAEAQGHTFLTGEQLAVSANNLLRAKNEPTIDEGLLGAAVRQLVERDGVVVEGDRIYRAFTHETEVAVAEYLRALLEAPERPLFPELAETDREHFGGDKPASDEQWSIVELVQSHRLSLLLGGPGVGKTRVIEIILSICLAKNVAVALAAPTGKAARRMSEVTGYPAQTVHRLLEYTGGMGEGEAEFNRNMGYPVDAELVIVDEASMLDLALADALFQAIGPETSVLLVGDPDQLPSVGCGRVLADLIDSDAVPMVKLNTIFRQAARSLVVVNARRINRGEEPYPSPDKANEGEERDGDERFNRDYYQVSGATEADVARLVVDYAASRVTGQYPHIDPIRDVQVLVPQHPGPIGSQRLNQELEAALNPARMNEVKQVVLKRGETEIFVGSKVIQTRNQYTDGFELMNGQIAVVRDHNPDDGLIRLAVDDGRELWFPIPELQNTLQLAWAISIHKSQGSEFPCVICVVSSSHHHMLSRSLFYTAVTRARELCLVIGDRRAVHRAVSHQDERRRNSGLAERIEPR
jgi:exodeoxyribonuclease V alpha subunit